MTTRDFIDMTGQYPRILIAIFVLPPVMAWFCGLVHGKDRGGTAPWKYFYSILVYLVCVPGLFASVLTAYTLFINKENLLDANTLVYFAPIVSMIVTLVFIGRNVSFDDVPGFERLSGLMVMMGCTFAIVLFIDRMHVLLWFTASMATLFLLALIVFLLLMLGSRMLFRRGDGSHGKASRK